jgi:hypothetical protein
MFSVCAEFLRVLSEGGKLPVHRFVVLNMPIFDCQPARDPYEVGREIIDCLPSSSHASAGAAEDAGDAKMADDAIPHEHLLEDLHASIRKGFEKRPFWHRSSLMGLAGVH